MSLKTTQPSAPTRSSATGISSTRPARGRVVGAVVDSVSDVLELGRDDIRPAPELACNVDASYITGTTIIVDRDPEAGLDIHAAEEKTPVEAR